MIETSRPTQVTRVFNPFKLTSVGAGSRIEGDAFLKGYLSNFFKQIFVVFKTIPVLLTSLAGEFLPIRNEEKF